MIEQQPHEAPLPQLAVWSTECIDGVWYVVRRGVWEASVRITPSRLDRLKECSETDESRAEHVCAVLNRIAG